MNNYKKIGLTALASSLVTLGSASAGELSVSGAINTTLKFGKGGGNTSRSLGADRDVKLTHVHDTGLLLNGTRHLQFYDASQYIAGSSATQMDIRATDEIELTATSNDLLNLTFCSLESSEYNFIKKL